MAYGDWSVTFTRRDGGATLTYTNTADTTRLLSAPVFEWQESHPKRVTIRLDNSTTTAANNFLSSSFDDWSAGSGALTLGDSVQLSYWPTDDTELRVIFDGMITELSQSLDGVLLVRAKDYLEVYENTSANQVIFSAYVDRAGKDATYETTAAYVAITGVTEANIVQPLAAVEYANGATQETDTFDGIDGTEYALDAANQYIEAQGFIAQTNGLVAVKVYMRNDAGDPWSDTLLVTLRRNDTGWGNYPGTTIASTSVAIAGSGSAETADYDANFAADNSNMPIPMEVGELYWLCFALDEGNGITYIKTEGCSGEEGVCHYYQQQTAASSYSAYTGCKTLRIYHINYDDIAPKNYYVDETNDKIYVSVNQVSDCYDVWNFAPARISCYTGTVTHQTICQRLIQYNYHSIDSVTSADQSVTYPTFSTYGMTLGDALRAACDSYGWNDSGTYYQTCASHYKSGATNYIKIGKRLNTANDSAKTFSHGADSATDGEKRILRLALRARSEGKPSAVTVVGETTDGDALVVTTHNYAKSGSVGAYMRGFTKPATSRNKDIKTLTDGSKYVSAILDSSAVGTYEGTITVSGCYPDMMDITTANATFGSGKIITLNYSPMGIATTKLKVKGVYVEGSTTELTLTNTDILTDNAIKMQEATGERNAAFYTPVGTSGTIYAHIYDAVAQDGATAYMSLQTDAAAEITGLTRMLCTKLVDSTNNLNIYHAEFVAGNGYSDSMIGWVKLYSAQTGGSVLADYDLNTASPTITTGFYKHQGDKLIVDYTCKIA